MIRYCRSIADIAEYQRGILPENAVRIDTPGENIMMKALPFGIAGASIITGIAMFLKSFLSGTMPAHPVGILLGCVLGFALLPLHELLHAVVYPKDAVVTIGRLKGKFTFVALASYPMGRGRFILMCLLPFMLGIVPLVMFLLILADMKITGGICFGAACIGLYSPCPDVYNVLVVLKHTSTHEKVMFCGEGLYRISS